MGNIELFKPLYDSPNPHTDALPGDWDKNTDEFEKMIILKCIRPDKIIPAIENWISHHMNVEYIKPPVFDLGKCFKDSTVLTPLIFVLSSGSDPVADFKRFAEEMDMNKRQDTLSLGSG
jgi:dynein heavy chain